MDKKEHKGGLLKNEEIEKELQVKGNPAEKGHSYIGSQDTGDSGKRERGSEVQREDGQGPQQPG